MNTRPEDRKSDKVKVISTILFSGSNNPWIFRKKLGLKKQSLRIEKGGCTYLSLREYLNV